MVVQLSRHHTVCDILFEYVNPYLVLKILTTKKIKMKIYILYKDFFKPFSLEIIVLIDFSNAVICEQLRNELERKQNPCGHF